VDSDPQPHAALHRVRRWLRWIVPFAVSGALLAWLFARTDFSGVVEKVDARVLAILLPALAVYGVVSLWAEAQSLVRAIETSGQSLGAWTCARIKAATYLFAIVHYAVGAGVLAVLLKRRTQVRLSDATGVVAFIAALDLIVLLFLAAIGAATLTRREPALQLGIVLIGVAGLVGGLLLLRAPIHLGGFIERIRNYPLFRAARTTSIPKLAELASLRLLFVASFMSMAAMSLYAFGIEVPVGDMIVGFTAVALVAALPIAVSGLGTGQAAWLYIFRHWSDPETLLASSLALSLGMIGLRAGVGLLFARELTREAMEAAKEVEA